MHILTAPPLCVPVSTDIEKWLWFVPDKTHGRHHEVSASLDKASTSYCMEISAEKTSWRQNNTSGINSDWSQWTEAWDSHKLRVPGLSLNWWRFQAWDTLRDCTDNSGIDKAETSLEWQEYFSQLQDTNDALPYHIHLPVCLWIMEPHSRAPKKNTSHAKWGATARYYTSHTKTMLPTRKSVPRSSRQMDHMKTSWRS